MTVRGLASAIALVVLAVSLAVATLALAQPPIEAFGSLPEYSQPALSPDGKHFAVVRAFKGRTAAEILPVDAPEGTRPALVDAPGGNIASIGWASNSRLIIIVKVNKHIANANRPFTWWRAYSVDTDGKNLALMLDDAPLALLLGAASIADMDLDDPDHVFMPFIGPGISDHHAALHLYRVNVNTGQSELFMPGTMWTAGWIMDGHGHVVARLDAYNRELKYHIKVPVGSNFVEIGAFDLVGAGSAFPGGVSDDGTSLVMEMPSASHTSALYRVDLASKAITPLYANPRYDIYRAIHDEWTGRVIGAAYIDDKIEVTYFDPRMQAFQTRLEHAFPGRQVIVSSCDVPKRSCIVAADNPRSPPTYYFIDVLTGHATLVGSAYPQLTQADLGEMRPYPYTARDGLAIPAYLTLPPGRDPHNLPLVVMPHGGPEVRDYMAFDWWAQFLANRGYAVLQPNFRGSDGYGGAFRAAGFRQWGAKMQDDLADGVAKLAADGTIDPKRVCIVGASYGGYAALAGAALTPDTYACAVSFAGVSDLDEMLHYEERWEGAESVAMSYLQARIGDRHNPADAARIAQISPAQQAAAVKIPVLLLHGADDTTVPIVQSKIMYGALLRAHKQVQFVTLEGDDHGLALAETRIRVLGEIEKFLAANIGR